MAGPEHKSMYTSSYNPEKAACRGLGVVSGGAVVIFSVPFWQDGRLAAPREYGQATAWEIRPTAGASVSR